MTEKGPIYGVELIEDLPVTGTMKQAMPGRSDLKQVAKINQRTVAGYEVLLAHYKKLEAEVDRLRELLKKSYTVYDDTPYQMATDELDRLEMHGGMYRWDDQAIDDARR